MAIRPVTGAWRGPGDAEEVGRLGSFAGTAETEDADGHHPHRAAPLGEWEYRPVQLAGDVPRMTAAVRLAIHAEFGGWELSSVRLYPGGIRKVLLRRRRAPGILPEPSV